MENVKVGDCVTKIDSTIQMKVMEVNSDSALCGWIEGDKEMREWLKISSLQLDGDFNDDFSSDFLGTDDGFIITTDDGEPIVPS